MQQRQLGNDGPQISVIGLGTWAIGGGDWKFGWGDQNDNDAIAAIHSAVDLGINWIDTAAVYGEGRSEELVGRALREIPADRRPLIATKCGRVPRGNGEIEKCIQRESVLRECDNSLRRLQVDCIDLYQLHWPEPDEDIEEGWETLKSLQQQGKVRWIGVSNHNVSQLKRLQTISPVTSLQPPYSMIARGVEDEILPYCGEHGIGVICYSPMGKGLLTGAFTAERAAALSTKDHRSRDPKFQSPQLEINLQFVGELRTIADGLGWTIPELAIAWVLRSTEVTAAIVGARCPQQIRETAVAGERVLKKSTIDDIDRAITARDHALSQLDNIARSHV